MQLSPFPPQIRPTRQQRDKVVYVIEGKRVRGRDSRGGMSTFWEMGRRWTKGNEPAKVEANIKQAGSQHRTQEVSEIEVTRHP